MNDSSLKELSEFISNDLRLKTFPIGVKFLEQKSSFPEKTRQPSLTIGKKITICQGVTMARLYGWTVGLTKEDLICVPAMITFGFTGAPSPSGTLARLFCDVGFSSNAQSAEQETLSMTRLENGQCEALLLAPLQKDIFEPDTVIFYANPAQVMRMIQAWLYDDGIRITSHFGGKVECTEYMIAPFKTQSPRVVIPGMGDRIFSMTQDDEMVFAIPGAGLKRIANGLKQAGKQIGARYPVTFYQNFQPEFPKQYKDLGTELGIA